MIAWRELEAPDVVADQPAAWRATGLGRELSGTSWRAGLAAGGRSGQGRLAFQRVAGATSIVRSEATSPLQLLAPRPRAPCAWAVLVGHGGGLLAGDEVSLELELEAGAAALVTTQAETKVYRSADGATARQQLDARIASGAALALFPDPVSPFAGARYDGRQRFRLEEGASLLSVDALVAGRSARGERWAFARHRSATEVWLGERLVLADALELEPRAASPDAGPLAASLASRLGRFEAFATVVLLGPTFAAAARALAARLSAEPVLREAPLLAAASPLCDGLLLRCAASTAERLTTFLHELLAPALSALGTSPFLHRW